jgi:competence protein ComEA
MTPWEPEREAASAQEIRDRLLRALAVPGPPDDGAAVADGTLAPDAAGRRPGVPSDRESDADWFGDARDTPVSGFPLDEPWGDTSRSGTGLGTSRRSALLGAFDPGRRGVRALVLVALAALVGAGLLAWYGRTRVEPVGMPAVNGGPAATAPSPSTATVVVAISGRVRRPGLLRLPAGSRVADAVQAAGGVLPGTDLAQLNLARRLNDGELVVVGASAGAGPSTGGGLVDLNTASAEELDRLPGVGPTLAQRIVDYRTANGGFRSVDQLREVDGIGPSKFAEIKDKVTV